MKKEDLKKHAVWLVPLGLAVICLIAFLASRAGSKPEEPEDVPRESVTKQVEEVEATSMHLRKKEGQLGITDGDGKDCPPRDNLGLYSGYHLLTQLSSYAWIGLDDVKLAKMDENSEMGIRKEGKDLTLFLSSGGVFFNVTEPLPEDETLNIRCSSMGIGIRGTCGWVQMTEDKHVMVYLLEGNVECKVTDGAGEATIVTVSAGEVGDLYVTPEGAAEVEVVPFAENYVAPFVMDELTADPELSALVLEVAGLDVLNPPDPVERLKTEYQEVIDGRTLYDYYWHDGLSDAFYFDLNNDGADELVLITTAKAYASEYEHYDYYYDGGIRQVEIFGDVQGHVGKLDEVIIDSSNDAYIRYDDFYPPNTCLICQRGGQYYICPHYFSEQYNGELYYLYGMKNNRLFIAEDFSQMDYEEMWDVMDNYSVVEQLRHVCPPLPADVQRTKGFLDDLLQDDLGMRCGAYAKLIDMNHDGIEDLLCCDVFQYDRSFGDYYDDFNYYALVWDGSDIERVDICSHTSGMSPEFGLYREKSTGDIYVGVHGVWGWMQHEWYFDGLSDSASYEYTDTKAEWIESDDDIETVRANLAAEWQAKLDEINGRFELIEELPPRDSDYEAWWATVRQTIDQLLNQIREKYPS